MSYKYNVRKIRRDKDLTQQELSDMSGITISMISKLERGETQNPYFSTVGKLASALEVTVDELIEKN